MVAVLAHGANAADRLHTVDADPSDSFGAPYADDPEQGALALARTFGGPCVVDGVTLSGAEWFGRRSLGGRCGGEQ
jgi:hypothetical protein